jgi:hypothetical protein
MLNFLGHYLYLIINLCLYFYIDYKRFECYNIYDTPDVSMQDKDNIK